MARQARVDIVNNPRTFRVPKGANVTWHNTPGAKEATVTVNLSTAVASDAVIDVFKTRAGSTTEIIAKHSVTLPPQPPAVPIKSGTPLDGEIFLQAKNEIRQEDKDAIDVRVNARYDSLGGTREP